MTTERSPVTRSRLRRDLVALGVEPGMTLVVHSSLSSIGWVEGGAPTLISALLEAIGDHGTLAMPAATPVQGDDPRVFDLQTTPTNLGTIPETLRTWPGTLRSSHPLESVCARGLSAVEITGDHPLAFSEGRGTPFDKLHELDSRILLLGVGFNRCTTLHFAESLVDKRRVMNTRFPSLQHGRRVWIEVPNVADDNDTHFPIIGKRYMAAERAKLGTIGEAPSILIRMRDLVDFARNYFETVL